MENPSPKNQVESFIGSGFASSVSGLVFGWNQLRRGLIFPRQDGFQQWFVLVQTTPARREVQRGLTIGTAQDGSAQKHCGPQSGRLEIAGVGNARVLMPTQQVDGEEHRQKRRFGRPEILRAEVIGPQIILQLLDALFDGGAALVITPQRHRAFAPLGHPEAEGIARHINELATDGLLVLAHLLAHHDETPFRRPAKEPCPKPPPPRNVH
jgi:hypothetical protein